MYLFCLWFLIFLSYSFLGYLVEVISCSLNEHKLVLNRGFCLGPYLPIYGFSCIIITLLLVRYREDPFVVFVMGAFISTVMEYFTSLILEKIFGSRWWDYSDKKFNICGRVCLENSFLFGIGGFFCLYVISPFLVHIYLSMPEWLLITISLVLLIAFVTDVIITIITLVKVKIASQEFKKKDATAEIRAMIKKELLNHSLLIRHMLNAFPRLRKTSDDNILARLKQYLDKLMKNQLNHKKK